MSDVVISYSELLSFLFTDSTRVDIKREPLVGPVPHGRHN